MSTILYFFDPSSREFIGSRPAQMIPGVGLESPANATVLVVPTHDAEQAAVFSGQGWDVVPDLRGVAYEKATGKMVEITTLGALDPQLTLLVPSPTDTWNEAAGAWQANLDLLRAQQFSVARTAAAQRLAAGFAYNGTTYPADPNSAAGYSAAAMQATVNKQSSPAVEIPFTSFGGASLTNDQMIALSQACQAFAAQVAQQLATVEADLTAATTAAAIEAVVLPPAA